MLVRRGLLLVLVALLIAGVPAASQPLPPRDRRAERVVEALLIWRLVDDLNLTDQQIARIFPQIKVLKEARLALGRRKLQLETELRTLLQAEPRDETKIRAKVAELERLRNQIIARREGALGDIHEALSSEQQGRFALIQETFEANTIRLLDEVRRTIEQHPQSGGRK